MIVRQPWYDTMIRKGTCLESLGRLFCGHGISYGKLRLLLLIESASSVQHKYITWIPRVSLRVSSTHILESCGRRPWRFLVLVNLGISELFAPANIFVTPTLHAMVEFSNRVVNYYYKLI